jgi:hypothetical protein
MEQSDSTTRLTPYELATLAARICPERCIGDPERACDAALVLLSYAKIALSDLRAWERVEEGKNAEMDAILKETGETRKDWSRGIKEITSEARRDRAIKRFEQFLEYQYPGAAKERLSTFKRDGFTEDEICALWDLFYKWKEQPKRKKGKQGRRKSKYDRRVRIDGLTLLPRKPRRPA